MPEVIAIDDPGDHRLDDYRELRDPEGRRRSEAAAGIFVGEGITVLSRLLVSRFPIRSVLVIDSKLPRVAPMLEHHDVPVYVASRDVVATIAGFDLHRGIVAVAERGVPQSLAALVASASTLVVLEGLNDPENLGAIARASRALGADGLVLDPTCADHLARRTVRVSMGEMLSLPVVRATSMAETLTDLRGHGFALAAMTPAHDAISMLEWIPAPRQALLFGAEGPGLTAASLAACDQRVRIPIRPDVDSLNVGHAVAVTLSYRAMVGERPR